MRTIRAIALLAAAAGPVLADTAPADCVPLVDAAEMSEAPLDLGQGFVAQHYFEGAAPQVPDAFVLFTECESGVRLIAAMPRLPDGSRRTAADIIGVMQDALAAERMVGGQELASVLTSYGAPAQLRASTTETCSCDAFYPGLQGDKTPWEPAE
ncbi:hypothetical protein [Roseisalinus antarcticus]|uniref:Uncharacterized protein n=1 Tax=Roseisalinus antarcticus TaxID=254357 RepID=A0A1Y5SN13_9RHOB|nr:hypothetical protein [Roseisalinus antarcticus]SLN41385.1 hypothetical protein ROA7023_01654 [Roseisalinus antarcticus]